MRAEPGGRTALRQVPAQLAEICRALTSVASGSSGRALIDDLRTATGGTTTEILWQALFADCLRVAYSAVVADGTIDEREIEALYEIITAAATRYAAGLSSQYGEFTVDDHESARAFLDRYAADRGPFGRGARIRWPGLTLCRRAAELGEPDALQRYIKAMTLLRAEACRLAGISDGDARQHRQIDDLAELKQILVSETTAMGQPVDRRVQAFLAPCRVFSAVQQASSIFENDPFDVEAVHRDARLSFEQLVAQATMRPHVPDLGRMLVVLGDSGAGKTHLLRGFRRHVQEGHRGFVIYAQLQSRTDDYSRYLLFHLVESLSRRYSEQSGKTGLRELASGLLRLARPPLRERLQRLADDTWDARGNLADHVNELVDELLGIAELGNFHPDLLRVLVYALRPDPQTTSSVYQYLRCDDMNAHDRSRIGGIASPKWDDAPHWMIRALARFAAVTQRALVVMVDQVDLAGFEADSTRIFRRAIDALYRIVSEIPSAVVVVACLSDLYNAARSELNRPALDRLENSPPIAKLQINRSYAEIEAVVARRLSSLFAEHGTVQRPEQPVYPIPESELRQLENRRLRDVLEWCHQFQTQCAAAGKIINADEPVTVVHPTREPDLDAIAAAWSEATQAQDLEMPDEEDEILAVVAETAKAYVHELGLSLVAPPYKNGVLRLQMSRGEDHAALAIAVANHRPQGGAFTGQIESLRRRARGMVPIAVRTLEFPRGRACDKAMGQLVNARGRGAYLDASTLRALVAFQRFQPPFAEDRISAWKLRDRPISNLPAVIEIFDFDRSRVDPSVGSGRRASTAPGETVEVPTVVLDPPGLPDTSSAEPTSLLSDAVPRPVPTMSTPRITVDPVVKTTDTEAVPEPLEPAAQHTTKAAAETGRVKTRGGSGPVASVQPLPSASAAATDGGMVATMSIASETPARGSTVLPTIPNIPSTEPTRPRRGQAQKRSERSSSHPTGAMAQDLWIGNSTSLEAEPILLDPGSLLRHIAVVGGTNGTRFTMALNLVEQALERGVPVILLDRAGEMSGYARPDWWQQSGDTERARQLAERIDVRLFTPGTRGGRPLSVAVIPDLSRVPQADHERTVQLAASAVAANMRAESSADGPERLALLTQAIALLARRGAPPAGLLELIALLEAGNDELASTGDDARLRQSLVEELVPLLGNADVFSPGAEPLTAATLLRPGSTTRVPLAIIHTGFIGEGPRLQSWVAHLLGTVNRELASSASTTLQALLVIDDADLFLPGGVGKVASRDPLQELFNRAGAAGVGLVLMSQRPGDLDYRRCTSVETWFVGKTDEEALDRMKPLFERRPLGRRYPSRLESGRFVMLHNGGARDVERVSPLSQIQQLEAAELKLLAAQTHPRVRDTSPSRRPETSSSDPSPLPPQPR